MALIGKIRNNMWLMIILIGLALAAFVIMDMTSGGGGAPSPNQFDVGAVDGDKIDWNEFQRMEQILYSGSEVNIYERRDYLWNFFVNRELINDYADRLGLNVGAEELMELQFGSNLSPIIQQRFANPQTGQVDRQTLNEFRQAINQNQLQPQQRQYWQQQEREIMQNRTQTKFVTLVAKGMYTPTWMAEREANLKSQQASFAYVKVPFAEVSNSEADVTEEDLQTFLSNNKKRFYREEETRIAEFARMRVLPTAQDSMQLREDMTALLAEFKGAENDSLFIEFNEGRLSNNYLNREQLNPKIQEVAFELEVGDTYGPYISQGNYQAIKVLGKTTIPDSVEARHIFRQMDPNNPASATNQKELLDSLKTLIESGRGSFDSLAMNNGQDGSAAEGGDLGYFTAGSMLPSFENKTFYALEIGELSVFRSQAGLHLVEVTDKKYDSETPGVKLGYLEQPIIPSEETQNRLYEDALTLASENRDLESLRSAANENPNLDLRVSDPLAANDYQINGINSVDAGRSIVKYLFDNETAVDEISPDVFIVEAQELFYNSEYIIVGLKSIIPEGSPKLEDVKSIVMPEVLKEKKGQLLREAMKNKDLNQLSASYSTPIDTVQGVGLNASRVPNLGNEPSVVAALQGLSNGQTSSPIVGENGVYVLQVTSKTEMPMAGNISQIKSQKSQEARQVARTRLLQAMQEDADIRDERSKFY
jgi:peptidyl-prolyl cis-trans isomerase D